MTELLNESRVSLTELARELGVSVSTIWRWSLRGIRGHRLECLNLGGRKYTSREAFERFVARTNGEPLEAGQSPRQREREIERVERQAAAEFGI